MSMSAIYWQGTGKHVLTHEKFPRASRYAPEWVFKNEMGPNPLWLTERLCGKLKLEAGMRVLDLGCGRGLSSVFLAKEYDVQVWALDLWIRPSENLSQFALARVTDKVFPIHAEAHTLPFAHEFFDCIISIDAYHYFGTDLTYMGYLAPFVKPRGQIGIVVPGLHQPLPTPLPAHLAEKQAHGSTFWTWDMCTFQTATWWHDLWSHYPFFDVREAQAMPDGGDIWLDWEKAKSGARETTFPADVEVLASDENRFLTFVEAIGQRTACLSS